MAKKPAQHKGGKAAPLQDGIPAIAALLQDHFKGSRAAVTILQIGACNGDGALTQTVYNARPNFNIVVLEKDPKIVTTLQANLGLQGLMQTSRVAIIQPPSQQSVPVFLASHRHREFDAAVSIDTLYSLSPEDQSRLYRGTYNIVKMQGVWICSEPALNAAGSGAIETTFRQRTGWPTDRPLPSIVDAAQMINNISGPDRFAKKDCKIVARAPVLGATFLAVKTR